MHRGESKFDTFSKAAERFVTTKFVIRTALVLNIAFALNFVYKFLDDIYLHGHEKLVALKGDHLNYLGILILDHVRNCKTLPDNLSNIEALQKCMSAKIADHNVNDIFNKKLFYRRTENKAYIGYYANTALSKTVRRINTSVVEIDARTLTVKNVTAPSSRASDCCDLAIPPKAPASTQSTDL